MRKFQCHDCGHTWELPFGEGGRGTDLTCPKCESTNVHRSSKEGGRGWRRHQQGEKKLAGRRQGWRRGWKKRHSPQDEG